MTQDPANDLRDALLSGRNTDGGWPYHAGRASRLEPTSWASLSLGESPSSLANWKISTDGLLAAVGSYSPNFTAHAVALISMRALGIEHAAGNARLIQAIRDVKGKKLRASDINRQDNSLQGWSWTPDTFSWVEPTAWCLLALKLWRSEGFEIRTDRIDEGERLLIDRCGQDGGWNYGNSNMLGQELKSFVPTTALGLLALQDRRSLPEVQRSQAFLEQNALSERSGLALSLALIALRIYERPAVGTVRDALLAQVQTTIEFGNQMAAAMALYALTSPDYDAFRL